MFTFNTNKYFFEIKNLMCTKTIFENIDYFERFFNLVFIFICYGINIII